VLQVLVNRDDDGGRGGYNDVDDTILEDCYMDWMNKMFEIVPHT
jgi:hypothetical protein